MKIKCIIKMNLNGSVYLIFFVSLFLIYYENVLYTFILCLYSILFKKDWTIVMLWRFNLYMKLYYIYYVIFYRVLFHKDVYRLYKFNLSFN